MILNTLMRSGNQAASDANMSAPFLCMRLMCSQDPAEVETVKKELFKAGIATETRCHHGIELWVQEERDFFNASTIFAAMQARVCWSSGRSAAKGQGEAAEHHLRVEKSDAEGCKSVNGADSRDQNEPHTEELEQASSLLEKEIEAILKRESEWAAEHTSLRSRVEELSQALAQAQATLASETENRAEAERKQAEIISRLQSTLERAETGRAQIEALLRHETYEWQQQLKLRDVSMQETLKKLEANYQLVQTHQTSLAKLRQEVGSLQLQRDEQEKALSKACADALMQREARVAAEDRAERAVAAQKSLEKQLADQKDLEQRMQAHLANLNSLYSRLHAKRAANGEQHL